MRRLAPVVAILLLGCAAIAAGQEATPLQGKVYLYGGETYEGAILVAEFGVVDGAGIGMERTPTNEYFSVEKDGEQVKVPVADIATIEATWEQAGPEGAKKWVISSLTITRKDGTQITGQPHWLLPATSVQVRAADGTIKRANALSTASADFDPSPLLVKIELGEAVTPAAPAEPKQPAEEASTKPAETPTKPSEAPTQPAETGPAAEQPAPQPAETAPKPTETAAPAGEAAAVGPPSTITLTVVCPKCGEKITVTIAVEAKTGG